MSTFISYAQNFEDVILRRAFSEVENGTYVDVGAQHPIHDSVTRAFYERGWRGINIEPVEEWHALLAADRPDDINLPVVVGSSIGEVTFYRVLDTGLSTMDAAMARQYAAQGARVSETAVPMRTLTDVVERAALSTVHFLKIDVEGAEGEVLRGMDFSKIRPRVVVVESTMPNTQTDVSHEWSHLLLDAGYDDVYFDGLNRFYLAREHADLTGRFAVPPNCFDEFVRYADWERGEQARKLALELDGARDQISELGGQISNVNDKLAIAQREVASSVIALSEARDELRESERVAHYWWHTAEEMRSEISLIKSSRSWKWTSPLRLGLRESAKILVSASKHRARGLLARAIRFALIRPAIKKPLTAVLRKQPMLMLRLKRFAVRAGLAIEMGPSAVSVDGMPTNAQKRAQLSPRANRILIQLEQAIVERRH
ncbi:FkbM family methyltransferase [Xanthomonas citri pv. fuscans CFBP 6996]|uniref:FkbM family methyltransferase n=1 Tax=Xanthomonas citri TaxID=346 RepID=UPI000C1754EC|nr:FkbM family methyltransferase [Xanthomonas citri]ATS53037.1 FkbM family methyltransferase [Xanthomonas citri pv. phaseoli var. fuscans]ATS54911.1 FkbM family methyltransferase [Xanthomonas citri pv. phaseoli var. fuscans]ATS61079.1 FkbM family methyltransferase [Xanthomonas citri pv. phaseoli var. fuscans]PTY29973.1 FkbM family methyltransferase [Xanthomonas citri pv. fuscans CFBP 6996]QWN17651.1 FkbM family methyltransferase [Xanthomonas citri]